MLGDFAGAMAISDQQLRRAEINPRFGISTVGFSTANSFFHRATFLGDLGQFDAARACMRAAYEHAEAMHETEIIGWFESWGAYIFVLAGETSSARTLAMRAINTNKHTIPGRTIACFANGLVLLYSEEPAAAKESLELALELSRANHVGRFFESRLLAGLAEAHLQLGDLDQAQAVATEAVRWALKLESPVGEICAQLARARILLTLDIKTTQSDIEASLNRAEALVASTGAMAFAPQIVFERARLAQRLGDDRTYSRLLRAAHSQFSTLGAHGHAERLAGLIAELAD